MAEGAVPGATAEHAALEALVHGTRDTGLTASGTAEIVATEWRGTDAVTVVFRSEDGVIHQQVLLRGQTARLRIGPLGQAIQFTGDSADFKLGMDALQIQKVGLTLAVGRSPQPTMSWLVAERASAGNGSPFRSRQRSPAAG